MLCEDILRFSHFKELNLSYGFKNTLHDIKFLVSLRFVTAN